MTSEGKRARRGMGGWSEEGRGSVLFIIVTLLALAAVPITVSARLASIETEIREVFDPSRDLAADLSAIHARQMARYQEYLLTGDPEAERRYRDLVQTGVEVLAELQEVFGESDTEIQTLSLPVRNASGNWQVAHETAFSSEAQRALYREGDNLSSDLVRYDALITASNDLREALNVQADAARQRMATVRDLQLIVTITLVGLALAGTFVIGRLSARLRSLVRDVSLRHRETLRIRRELDAVFDATADAVLEVDREARVLRLNEAGTRLLGWTEEAARGESLARVLFGASMESEGDRSPIIQAVLEGRSVDGADSTIYGRRSDRATPVLWSARPVGESSAGGGVVTLTDVTDIRAATQALERSVQAREETLAVVSHDLRSPLSSVQATAELLLEVPLPPEKQEAQLRGMLRASERMERLIQDLLDLARIDGGGLTVRREQIAAGSVAREAVGLLAARAKAARIRLGIRAEEPGPMIHADHDRLLQVFENLISNALRHTDPGGRVAVIVEEQGQTVRFRVRDTGHGIPAAQITHLFDRFWRPETGRSGGAGLGLAIVKGIVEAHGGQVSVWSEPGEGTEFSFSIPCVESPVGGTSGADTQSAAVS